MKALVRRPSPRLAEGIVTHIERSEVDIALAFAQWERYVAILAEAGFDIVELPRADECPDGVFVEDVLVVDSDLAVVTRPGAEPRRDETVGLVEFATRLGLRTAEIGEPATLDGGDVVRTRDGLLVGVGARTNTAGAEQLAAATGLPIATAPVEGVLHLKTGMSLLPDGSLLPGSSLDLGGGRVMLAADSPHVNEVEARGIEPVICDISEFRKVEAGVTCLSVLVRSTIST
jgi:dimethylargininase